MQLSETELLALLNTSESFRETCAHTLAALLADNVHAATVEACQMLADESDY